jgi:predicted ATP-grasp superfamily ATP-dependent carboligase
MKHLYHQYTFLLKEGFVALLDDLLFKHYLLSDCSQPISLSVIKLADQISSSFSTLNIPHVIYALFCFKPHCPHVALEVRFERYNPQEIA